MIDEIRIEYANEFISMCSTKLTVHVTIDSKTTTYEFPDSCLDSGGKISSYKEGYEITTGPWAISDWPDGFPELLKPAVVEMVNKELAHGCCGSCI